MSTARPFAYNPSPNAVIAGTEQVGDLAVGTPTSGFTTNPQFWNGPDEDLGYVIAYPVSGNTHPTPIFGVFASVGFAGTKNMTNPFNASTFLELVNSDAPSPPGPFTSATDASIFLTANGYWNSYQIPTYTTFLTDLNGYATDTLACLSGTTDTNKYLTSGTTQPTVGQFVYNDTSLTSPYNGGNTWHVMANVYNNWAVNIGIAGAIAQVTNCTSIPTPTPTVTSTSTPTPTSVTPTPSVTNTQTPTNTETPTQTPTQTSGLYTVGQAVLGGVIGYIYGGGSTGTSGIVVNTTNISNTAAWGCQGTSIETSAAIGMGDANTIAIMAGCATAGIAARLCGDLVEGGYSDWYLPSKDELEELYLNRVAIGVMPGGYYWSSTQQGPDYAWVKNFADATDNLVLKSAGAPVRAVRTFGTPLTPTPTPTNTATPTNTPTVTETPTNTPTETPSVTPTNTETPTETPTPEPTTTPTNTETPTPTPEPTTTPTNTETPTNTPTETPTNTPTPSVTPIPVTGYGFNLVATPYNPPTISGTSIINNVAPINSGDTNPNVFANGAPNPQGFYFNPIDNTGVDRTNYFSGFTGQSITITFNQTGSTSIYSGDTNSLQTWSSSGVTGFVFGEGITSGPSGLTGNAILIQSATTQWTIGVPVYVSVEINNPITPTPTNTNTQTPTPTGTPAETPTNTPTNTETPTPTPTGTPSVTPTNTETPTPTVTESPTPTPTPIPTFTIINNSTGDRTVTSLFGNGPWNLNNGSYPILAGQSANGFTHPSLTALGLDQLIIGFGGSNAININITKNGSPYTASSTPASTNMTASQINYFVNAPADVILENDIIVITITNTA